MVKKSQKKLPACLLPISESDTFNRSGKISDYPLFLLQTFQARAELSFFGKGVLVKKVLEESSLDDDLIIFPKGPKPFGWELSPFGYLVEKENINKNGERVIIKGKKNKYYQVNPNKVKDIYSCSVGSKGVYLFDGNSNRTIKKSLDFFSGEMLGNFDDYFYGEKKRILRDFLLKAFKEK